MIELVGRTHDSHTDLSRSSGSFQYIQRGHGFAKADIHLKDSSGSALERTSARHWE